MYMDIDIIMAHPAFTWSVFLKRSSFSYLCFFLQCIIRCTYPGCQCAQFSPVTNNVRQCGSCPHGWVPHGTWCNCTRREFLLLYQDNPSRSDLWRWRQGYWRFSFQLWIRLTLSSNGARKSSIQWHTMQFSILPAWFFTVLKVFLSGFTFACIVCWLSWNKKKQCASRINLDGLGPIFAVAGWFW